MPPLPPAASILLVRLKGTNGSSAWNNVMHVRYSGAAPSSANLVTLANAIGNAWATSLAPLAPTVVTLREIDIADLTSPTAAVGSASMTHAGTRTGSGFTAQVAMVGSWIAALRFRGGHFRQYWPFGVQTDQGSITTWSSAFQTAAQAGLESFRVAINALSVGTATCQLVGLSYFTAHALRPTPLPVPIDAVVVHGRIDTQRRRLGKEVA